MSKVTITLELDLLKELLRAPACLAEGDIAASFSAKTEEELNDLVKIAVVAGLTKFAAALAGSPRSDGVFITDDRNDTEIKL